ncbi:MAG TPA: hypothetical protein VNE63_05300 [Candidatus Acidoferrales bacterium]|nr:hypothetical protein [Candidatus Acidoferrales bacterium]
MQKLRCLCSGQEALEPVLIEGTEDHTEYCATDIAYRVRSAAFAHIDVALGMAQKAKSLMPDVAAISDTLTRVMPKKGDYSGAIPLLKKAPDPVQFHYHLGLALLGTGQ